MKRRFVGIVVTITYIFLVGCGRSLATQMAEEQVPYIATVNGVRLPLDEYFIYLRTEVARFEETGGEDIWRVPIGGVPSIELAKNNALEVMLFVEITNQQADIPLSDESIEMVESQTQIVWETLYEWERELIPIEALRAVLSAFIRSGKVQEQITENYNEADREMIFERMFEDLRNDAQVVRNATVWDGIEGWNAQMGFTEIEAEKE